MTDLWYGTSGPKDADIVLVGEAWGFEEGQKQLPFVGESGKELTRILAEAGVKREELFLTNVVAKRPPNNNMWMEFEAEPERGGAPAVNPSIGGLRPSTQTTAEVRRLYDQLRAYPRKLVIGAGNYPLWALTNHAGAAASAETARRKVPTGIMSWRGSMTYTIDDRFTDAATVTKTKFLPIIHPTSILRAWENRSLTVHDLRARVPFALRDDWRPANPPIIWAPPTFEQAKSRLTSWLQRAESGQKIPLAVDIETYRRSVISCIGFSDSANFAMSIPLLDISPTTVQPYWSNAEMGVLGRLIQKVLCHPNILVEGQNFIYDIQYLYHWLGVIVDVDFDTMLAHHLVYPGTAKGLDTLSSLYCHYHWYWKDDNKDWIGKGGLRQHLQYNALDCIRTREVAESLRQVVKHLGMEAQWQDTLWRHRLCLDMMLRGTRIDIPKRTELAISLVEQQQQFTAQLLKIVPQDLVIEFYHTKTKPKGNWTTSPKQQQTLFYTILGMKEQRNRKTGRASLDKEALDALAKKYPLFKRVFDLLEALRSIGVFYNTFVKAPLEPNDRIRCSFNPGGTETFRLSSSKNAFDRGTNLQNIPKGDED